MISKKHTFFILITMILIFSGCELMPNPNFSNISNQNETHNSITKKSDCEDIAKTLVPKYFTLHLNYAKNWFLKSGKWSDGTSLGSLGDKMFNNYYHTGNVVGQNVNYYYLDSVHMDSLPNSYDKTIISENGVILGNNHFSANFVLKLNKTFVPVDRFTYETIGLFEVIDFKITSCNFISYNYGDIKLDPNINRVKLDPNIKWANLENN